MANAKGRGNNDQIDTIHSKWQTKLQPIQQQLNTQLKQKWQEWEIPRESQKEWTKKAKDLLAQWWEIRQQRQKEIDDTIAKHSDTETLYDQPIEEKSQNQTWQVKPKPARSKSKSKSKPDIGCDFDLAGFLFNLPGLVLILTFYFRQPQKSRRAKYSQK